MNIHRLAIAALAACVALPASASVLIFKIDGVGDFGAISQDYGDRIQAADEGKFHYGLDGGITPNVVVDYAGFEPSHWGVGYGDLVNVLFDDVDNRGVINIVLTADPGFTVSLASFDMSAYDGAFNGDPIIDSLTVTVDCTEVLREENLSVSEKAHNSYDFGGSPVTGRQITIAVRCGNLGGKSDDIGLDNILFSQNEVEVGCYADFTADGALDLFDFLGFVNAFNAADPKADCDYTCSFDLFDFLCFTNAFNAGC